MENITPVFSLDHPIAAPVMASQQMQ